MFVNPGATMAQPRRIVGGHSVALVVAFALSGIFSNPSVGGPVAPVVLDILAAMAVGVAMLLMAVTNTEHAPAAGTVLGLVIEPWSTTTAIAVLGAALVLAAVRIALKRSLIDLVWVDDATGPLRG